MKKPGSPDKPIVDLDKHFKDIMDDFERSRIDMNEKLTTTSDELLEKAKQDITKKVREDLELPDDDDYVGGYLKEAKEVIKELNPTGSETRTDTTEVDKTESELTEIREQLQGSPMDRVIAEQAVIPPQQNILDLGTEPSTMESIPTYAKEIQEIYHQMYEDLANTPNGELDVEHTRKVLENVEGNITTRLRLVDNDLDASPQEPYGDFLHQALGEVQSIRKSTLDPLEPKKYDTSGWFLKEALFRLEVAGLIPDIDRQKVLDIGSEAMKRLSESPYLDVATKEELTVAFKESKVQALKDTLPVASLPAATGTITTGLMVLLLSSSIVDAGALPVVAIIGGAGSVATIITSVLAWATYKERLYYRFRDNSLKTLGKMRDKVWKHWFPKELKPQVDNIVNEAE